MTEQLPAASLEYVLVLVTARRAGAVLNPTGDAVRMAFTSTGAAPTAPDWKTASWDTDPGPPAVYRIKALVGPGGGVITLTAGTYHVWVEITDSPEKPVKHAGLLEVI